MSVTITADMLLRAKRMAENFERPEFLLVERRTAKQLFEAAMYYRFEMGAHPFQDLIFEEWVRNNGMRIVD